ncbi:class III chitinase ChiA2 [Lindgomyces ingoldianus]|uniref:Class III chitinase ChiA2 n=1 Tax=Lindgomyces ingoldianus TaxID=673940 RepID=A0ACB6QLZ4_9PLEO|nr:class III chitinase ChiA2 [Lindgomyces ingoldianus]KAF2467603.1 class III chitinase ChiA2 [Lindgomyces ingoldianus]
MTRFDSQGGYAANGEFQVILLSFLVEIVKGEGNQPVLNFANQGDKCSKFPGTELFKCPEIEQTTLPLYHLSRRSNNSRREDIQTCQTKHNKTILLSIGGATYSEGGFISTNSAVSTADKIWEMFGHYTLTSTINRPFGNACVDGFDFDIEANSLNMDVFANKLRKNMDGDQHSSLTAGNDGSIRRFYLSAAPQCPQPDWYTKDILERVRLDMVFVQFYNNYCGVSAFVQDVDDPQPLFNLKDWNNWAKHDAVNKNVKVFVGVPGNANAGSGYASQDKLGGVVKYSTRFDSFAGIMVWDASSAWGNGDFISDVKKYLKDGGGKGHRVARGRLGGRG